MHDRDVYDAAMKALEEVVAEDFHSLTSTEIMEVGRGSDFLTQARFLS